MSEQDLENTTLEEHHGVFDDAEEITHTVPISQQLVVLSIVLLGIFGAGFVPKMIDQFSTKNQGLSATIPLATQSKQTAGDEEIISDGFDNISLVADSVFVFDVTTQKVLFSKNPDTQVPLASVTKLMTALVAYEILTQDVTVEISNDALKQDGESGFLPGESFNLERLIDLTLVSSSNDGAFALAEVAGELLDSNDPATAFVEAMNIRAEEIGLTQTYFRNPTGLDISNEEAGAYGSARDMAFLMEYILKNHPALLEKTTDYYATVRNSTGGYHNIENTNYTVNRIPGLLGSKTGYTVLAGGNLVTAFDASINRPVIVSVLRSSADGRFSDNLKLSQAARAMIE